jgi:hypothetical protein
MLTDDDDGAWIACVEGQKDVAMTAVVGVSRPCRCKYAPEDRERIRRERNRIHAKRTRDRRKKFMEDSEKVRGAQRLDVLVVHDH